MKTRIVKLIPLILGSTLPCYVASVARADTDWVLVLDRSESMTQNDPANYRFDAQKIMVDLLAQEAQEIHRLTIIRFAGTPEVVLDRVELKPANLDTVRRTISEDPPKGDTDIGAALAMARSISKAEGRTADVHIILLSDGVLAGKIPNLVGRLEEQKKAFQELGLPVNTILLNDFSITQEEREERRRRKLYYDDRQLQAGEDLMRDLARRSGGEAVQVLPERGVEDILIGLIAPHMSFHRESVTGRLTTWPTDRQLFFVLDRKAREVNLRIAAQDVKISLEKAQKVEGDFEVVVAPYAKRTVLMVRPKENVRWPEWLEVLPTGSDPVLGEVFV
ncbi:MAG TPA: VWA domain-containing protein, partial [Planctomycetota bacterium]|nr:VWA domain-containing protein [Planctomycetota bacterium]